MKVEAVVVSRVSAQLGGTHPCNVALIEGSVVGSSDGVAISVASPCWSRDETPAAVELGD